MQSVVVIDYGSDTIKAGSAVGFPTDSEPKYIQPCAVSDILRSSGNAEKSPLSIRRPVLRGCVHDLDALEAATYHVLYNLMGWEFGGEGSLVVADPLFTSKATREQLTQLAFEVFNTTGFFVQDQLVLSLFSVGKLSGCVLDIGHGKLDIATVADGQVNMSSARRLSIAGVDLTAYMARLLRKTGMSLKLKAVQTLKESAIRVCESHSSYEIAVKDQAKQSYSLPDGQTIELTTEGLETGEFLVDPSSFGHSSPGLAETMVESVWTTYAEHSTRKQTLENIVVCGGGSGACGLGPRVLHDLKQLLPPSMSPFLCPLPEYMPSHTEKYAAWLGGAIMAKVVHQQNQFVSKADYEEFGPVIVHRRCG